MIEDVSLAPGRTVAARPKLAAFRSGHSSCDVALWIDIEARIVLAVDSDLLHPQENLDAMCTSAVEALNLPPLDNDAPPHQIMFSDRTRAGVVLRDLANPSQALMCTCSPGVDLPALAKAMATFLSDPEQIQWST